MKRSLPSNPSVDHLKKQAKAVLASCRESDPYALRRLVAYHPRYTSGVKDPQKVALQEVQLVVAREYGYTSWPHLIGTLQQGGPVVSSDASGILLYTNGTSAIDILNTAKVPGTKREWIEALHDGPVPLTKTRDELYRIRADHFAALGWTSAEEALKRFGHRDEPLSQPDEYTELQLWFEHDLFDQLQLIQLLDHLSDFPAWQGKTVLYQFDAFLGRLRPEQIRERQPRLIAVTEAQIDLARTAWKAFRQESPEELMELAGANSPALPFLQAALLRLCQEFPSPESGLGRTEAQILSAVAAGNENPRDIFRHNQDQEEAQFTGDSSFFAFLQRLTIGPRPLLRTASGEPFRTPAETGYTEAFRNQSIHLTEAGEAVRRGDHDWLASLPAPYWIGGVRIAGPDAARWKVPGG